MPLKTHSLNPESKSWAILLPGVTWAGMGERMQRVPLGTCEVKGQRGDITNACVPSL